MKSPNIRYLPGVDQLRGIAALLIVFYHTLYILGHKQILGKVFAMDTATSFLPKTKNFVLAIWSQGHIAVGLFMVLSGFIFSYGAHGRSVAWGAFMKNRLLRIYPLFIALVMFSLATTTLPVTFTAVLQTVSQVGLKEGGIPWTPFTSMFWTIAIEMQFYAIFPLLFAVFSRDPKRWLPLALATMIALRTLSHLFGADLLQMTYYSITGRIDQFLLGMLAGYLYAQRTFSEIHMRRLFPAAFVVLLAVVWTYHCKGGLVWVTKWRIIFPTLEGGLWAMFILSYLVAAERLPHLIAGALERAGTISFSIYMLHIPVIWLCSERNWFINIDGAGPYMLQFLNVIGIVLPMTLALGTLTYLAIEKPFLSLRVRYLKAEEEKAA